MYSNIHETRMVLEDIRYEVVWYTNAIAVWTEMYKCICFIIDFAYDGQYITQAVVHLDTLFLSNNEEDIN